MKLVRHLSLFVLSSILLSNSIVAQTIELPNISSQYLNQGNDYGAILLVVQYTDGKAHWVLDKQTVEFSQQKLYQYLDQKFENLTAEAIQQSNLKLEAPTNLPIHYLQDIYAWVQIYGNKSLHLAMYESMTPEQKQYLPLDILPFTVLEEACAYYASNTRGSNSAIGTFSTLHPNSEHLTKDKNIHLGLAPKATRPEHYIPQNILHIDLRENNEIIFKGRQANPMVLGSLVQSELAKNYANSYEKASPKQYLWINLRMNKTVTYQQYAEVLVALQEAFHLYWEELAFNKFQKTYLELDVQQRWSIQQASPKLITQYDAIELLYIEEKLITDEPKKWSDLK
ncbi:hypothetical protein [Aureispira anguillae]|uniref:Uncharacterized protein n=1 Tax=Aureispira anguillae TaxID=2864201 RepID=A0A916DVK5_9BACT|nr:hypothetical protein [Aureispira anguillae]BDS15234.1 hypothetical protein AsAng_0060180 [Aureispira anguillae]